MHSTPLGAATSENAADNVTAYASYGYNMIHVVPDGSVEYGFNFTEFNAFLDKCDELGLWVMYDMRSSYQNATSVTYQVNQLKTRKSILLWYTGDEPDGNSDPIDAPKKAYDLIKSLDPYHPISLCLNCYNFHYEEYSSGADIVMEDVYPIAVDTSYSTVYDTTCNNTYGCCGCDDCHLNPAPVFAPISKRLDLFAQYQTWLGLPPKPRWGVPQAFGDQSFWTRNPIPNEEVVMDFLRLNHGAKAIVSWLFPTTPELRNATSAVAAVLTRADVAGYTLGTNPVPLSVSGSEDVDAAAWTLGNKTMVSIVNLSYDDSASSVEVTLPKEANNVEKVYYGQAWELEGKMLKMSNLKALEVDFFLLGA